MMERMNQNEAKHPPTQAMLNVLKELFLVRVSHKKPSEQTLKIVGSGV
jgi:hypothetical protein